MASADILRAARARIEDPKNWARAALATNGSDRWVEPDDVSAECWCAIGALMREGGLAHGDERELLDQKSQELFRRTNVALVNDDEGHGAVLKVFDAAIAVAEAEAGR